MQNVAANVNVTEPDPNPYPQVISGDGKMSDGTPNLQQDEAGMQAIFNEKAQGANPDIAGKTLRRTLRGVLGTLDRMNAAGLTQETAGQRSPVAAQALVNLQRDVKQAKDILKGEGDTPGMRYMKMITLTEQIVETLVLLRSEFTEGRLEGNAQDNFAKHFQPRMAGDIPTGLIKYYHADNGEQAGAVANFASLAQAKQGQAKTSDQKAQRITTENSYFELDANVNKDIPRISPSSKKSIEAVRNLDPAPTVTQSDTNGVLNKGGNPMTASMGRGRQFGYKDKAGNRQDGVGKRRKEKAEKEFFSMVIDVTNIGFFSPLVAEAIQEWKRKYEENPNYHLILFASLLKHEELGTDKAQAGRAIVFGNAEGEASLQSLKTNSDASQDDYTNDFLNLMVEISLDMPREEGPVDMEIEEEVPQDVEMEEAFPEQGLKRKAGDTLAELPNKPLKKFKPNPEGDA